MRGLKLPVAIALAVVVLGGCGGNGGGGGGGGEEPAGPELDPVIPPREEVSTTVRDYLTAFNDGDAKRACRFLDERGLATLAAFLSGDQTSISCRAAVRRVSRRIGPVRRFKIENVRVTGRSATADVEVTDPPSSSAVLLAADPRGGWKISYPPGLRGRSGEPPPRAVPGVPLQQD